MQSSPPSPNVVRFGLFEADLVAGELRKRGRKIELQDRPFHVLALLLQRPKEIVTREELWHALWPADTFVEFEESLNKAVHKLRQALGDSAENPRFIETLPRRGYRFIAQVEVHQRRHSILWAVSTLVVLIGASIGFWWSTRPAKAPDGGLVPIPLNSYPGEVMYPSFSPDGTQVAFQWRPGSSGANCDIYIKQIGVGAPFRLTDDPREDYSPAWSPDGQNIAFLRDLSPKRVALVLAPHRKGPERVLTEFDEFRAGKELRGPYLAWTPDSKWVISVGLEGKDLGTALFLVSAETGERRRLTASPATNQIYGDTCPAVSPDGRTLAFYRKGIGPSSGLYVVRLDKDYAPRGELERITSELQSTGVVWTADGSEILFSGRDVVYTAPKSSNAGLWRVAASKSAKPRRVAFASGLVSAPAVSRHGNRLAYVVPKHDTNIWRLRLLGPERNPGTPAKFISSHWSEYGPAYSPDGKKIAFLSDRSELWEVWVSESDGSRPVKLSAFGGTGLLAPRWSPDGKSVIVTTVIGRDEDIRVLRLKDGLSRRLTEHPAVEKWPYWSRDGQWLYFASDRGGTQEIWKMPSSGGEAVQVTRNGGDFPQESPDGKFVYYEKGWPSLCSIWRIPVEGGEEKKVLDSVDPEGKWAVGNDGIYFFSPAGETGRTDIQRYEFASGKTRKIVTIEGASIALIAVSPDGRSILYSQEDESGSDLMLVENFR